MTRASIVLALIALLGCDPASGQQLRRVAPIPAGRGSGELLVADVDGDGKPDLLSKHLLERRVAIHRGHGDGTFAAGWRVIEFDYQPGTAALGDVDGDGRADLIVASRDSSSEYVHLLRATPSGFLEPSAAVSIALHVASPYYKPLVLVADVNRDGVPDIVAGNGRRSSLEVLVGAGDGRMGAPREVRLVSGAERHEFDLGDVNGDGIPDVVDAGGIESGPDGFLMVYPGDGKGSFAPAGVAVRLPPAPRGTRLVDFDRDGDLDALTAHAGGAVSLLLNDGTGRLSVKTIVGPLARGGAFSPLALDLDGDGKMEIVVSTGDSVAILGGPDLGPLPGRSYAAGPGAYRITSADFDGNGRPDIVASSFGGDTITVLLGR
ncbi:MAG TPA: VCBS repeat-containing protein [Gemmatimonadales bacterium]